MVLHRRVSVKGFICLDWMARYAHVRSELTELVKAGQLVYKEDIQDGLDNYVDAINRLFDGSNSGKLILKL